MGGSAMIAVHVHFYAQLKDFFGDTISVELPENSAISTILEKLKVQNALAADWLKVSRVASDDAFLNEDDKISDGGRYYILPPSSGG